MPGELWRGSVQAAVESSYGTTVTTATRRLYYEDPKFTIVRAPKPHKFATATRDNQRSLTIGPSKIAGELKQPLSADEIIELLLLTLRGAVTPSQPSAGPDPTVYLWTFTPSSGATPLDSASFQWSDGARVWQTAGTQVDKLQIQGSADGPNEVTATMFGKSQVIGSLTGSLGERTPTIIEGWETSMYIDAIGATPGTTPITGTLINWDVQIMNNLARKYFAANSNTLGSAPTGALDVTATLTFEAAPTATATEFNNWNVAGATPTDRLIRLAFGHNTVISNAYTRYVDIDLPGSWTGFDLGQGENNTRVYRLTYEYLYDVTNTFGVQVKAENTRATAW